MLHWSFLHSLSLRVSYLRRRFELGFQSGFPGDLPLPTQPVLQAYVILNAVRYRKPWVVTRATFGSRSRQSLQNGAEEVLNERFDCYHVVHLRIERKFHLASEFVSWPSQCA